MLYINSSLTNQKLGESQNAKQGIIKAWVLAFFHCFNNIAI